MNRHIWEAKRDLSAGCCLLINGTRKRKWNKRKLAQSRSQSPRYPRPAVGNEGLWDKAFTGKQESCDRSNCAGVRHSHIRFYQMQSLFHEAIEFSMEKLGIKVLMKEQCDALLKSYMCRRKVCWWHADRFRKIAYPILPSMFDYIRSCCTVGTGLPSSVCVVGCAFVMAVSVILVI